MDQPRPVVCCGAVASDIVGGCCENLLVTEGPLREPHRPLQEAMDALSARRHRRHSRVVRVAGPAL